MGEDEKLQVRVGGQGAEPQRRLEELMCRMGFLLSSWLLYQKIEPASWLVKGPMENLSVATVPVPRPVLSRKDCSDLVGTGPGVWVAVRGSLGSLLCGR